MSKKKTMTKQQRLYYAASDKRIVKEEIIEYYKHAKESECKVPIFLLYRKELQ
jgi:hypothetical protein